VWAYQTLMGFDDDIFRDHPLAIDINDTRALHAAELVRMPLRQHGRIVPHPDRRARRFIPEDVGDTRYSGSEILVRKITRWGPTSSSTTLLKHCGRWEKQDTYRRPGTPGPGSSANPGAAQWTSSCHQDLSKAMRGPTPWCWPWRTNPNREPGPR